MKLISRDKALMNARPEYLNPNQEKLASYNQGWNNAIEMYCRQIAKLPTAEPKEYVKNGTLTVQMPTIKEAKAIDKIVIYVDTYKQEYYMPLPKVGKWIEVRFKTVPTNRIARAKKCSICGKRKDKYVIWNYCPNCGAKMEGE